MLKGQSSFSYLRNDVRTYASAIAAAGGILSLKTQLACNQFLNRLQENGILVKTKDCGLFLGSTLNSALIKLIGSGNLINNGLSLTYAENLGISGNSASTGRIETGFIPTNNGLSSTNLTILFYALSNSWATGVSLGSGNPATLANGNTYLLFAPNALSYAGGGNPSHPIGRGAKTIRALADVQTYTKYLINNTVALGANNGSATPPNTQSWLFNHYFNSTYFPCGAISGGYWIGESLSQSEIGHLSSAFDQIQHSVGRGINLTGVFFGDSITAGIGASVTNNRWSTQVALSLGITENNKGISGTVLQNTVPTQSNNGRDRYLADVYNQAPWKAFILYGLNDLRYNDPAYTVTSFQNDLNEVVQGLINGGMPSSDIILGTPPYMNPGFYPSYAPFNGGSLSRHQAHADAIATVAATNGTKLVDVFKAMQNNGGNALVSSDGIHPNDVGHTVIAQAFLASV